MAAQSRGSVKVFVHPPNDSFEAMATLFSVLPLGQNLEQQLRTAAVQFHVADAQLTGVSATLAQLSK